MKRIFLFLSFALFLFVPRLFAQTFTFAFVSDTHVSTADGTPAEDLQRTIEDINRQPDLAFVLLTGDITEMGTNEELRLAKDLISQLNIPYYIVPGNHDTGWSESGGVSFIREFGYDKFVFEHEGYKIIGCASGPYVRMSDGHIPRDAIVWLDSILAETPEDQPLIFVNHYPLDNSLDNWYEAIDRLKQYNTQFAICGHGHRNKAYDFEGIPGTMGRSNLRAKEEAGGYNIVEVRQDSVLFSERTPGVTTHPAWRKIALGDRSFDTGTGFERPSYEVNDRYAQVKRTWEYHSDANVVSTPAYTRGLVIFGNSLGKIEALSGKDGKSIWSYQTGSGIFSSPAVYKNTVILGSGDGNIYCLQSKSGKLVWKAATGAAVLGSPVVGKGVVYIGGSDGKFRALDADTGRQLWAFEGLEGPVVSQPLLYDDKVIFGAWDRHLYALHAKDGLLAWKWDNGSPNRMYSPAMCIPVAHDGVIYIVAPDRYISAIEAATGKTLWRSNEATVRESIGISGDGQWVYGKTMNDEIVAFETSRESGKLAWRMDCHFGYEHVPSMLVEKNGTVYFGTRNGVVYAIDPENQRLLWRHKIDNSMVNTVRVIDSGKMVAATMDGKIVQLTY